MGGAFGHGLGTKNESDGGFASFQNQSVPFVIHSHAQHFGKHQRDDSVAIHPSVVLFAEVSVLILPVFLKNEVQRLPHHPPLVIRVDRLVAHCGHGHERERRHGGVVATIENRSVTPLFFHEKANAPFDRLVDFVGFEGVTDVQRVLFVILPENRGEAEEDSQ